MNGSNDSSNTVAMVAIVAIVLILVGAAIWFMNQPRSAPNSADGAKIDVRIPDLKNGAPQPAPAPSPTPKTY